MSKREVAIVDKKPVIILKEYSREELQKWSEKFKGLHMNDKAVLFGAYSVQYPQIYGGKVKTYSVIMDADNKTKVKEFENLIDQINRMNFGEQKKIDGLEEMAEQIGFFPSSPNLK